MKSACLVKYEENSNNIYFRCGYMGRTQYALECDFKKIDKNKGLRCIRCNGDCANIMAKDNAFHKFESFVNKTRKNIDKQKEQFYEKLRQSVVGDK